MRRTTIPDRDDANWMKHSVSTYVNDRGEVEMSYRPVRMQTLTNEVSGLPAQDAGLLRRAVPADA